MEIHKIKPIHSWRDFAKELGTIVLGIVIAITLEHLVEEWSWNREVATARQALFAEISTNTRDAFAYRVAVASCVDRQLREAQAVLGALEAGRKTDGITNFNPAIGRGVRDSEWQAERASQVLTHFPRPELALLSRHYGQLDEFTNWMTKETDVWLELGALQHPMPGLMASDLMRLRTALAYANSLEYRIVVNSIRQVRNSKLLGLPDLPPDPLAVKNYCTMGIDAYRRYRSGVETR